MLRGAIGVVAKETEQNELSGHRSIEPPWKHTCQYWLGADPDSAVSAVNEAGVVIAGLNSGELQDSHGREQS